MDTISNAASQASDLIKAVQQYNTKLIEFAQTNSQIALEFAQKMMSVKSPGEFVELSTEHARRQFETMTEQAKELAELGQRVTLSTGKPLQGGITRAFGRASE